MCVVLSHIARLLEMLQHIFYMTSISGDTQLRLVPEVLYCHVARGGGDTPHLQPTSPKKASPQPRMHSVVRSQWLGHYWSLLV